MREIVMDTETTGLDPESGDRIVEIGAVELMNHVATGRTFHEYINPMRSMPAEAFAVHGLGDEFLSDKPTFDKVAQPFLDFVGDAKLVIHNAAFDMKFLNAELRPGQHAQAGASYSSGTRMGGAVDLHQLRLIHRRIRLRGR